MPEDKSVETKWAREVLRAYYEKRDPVPPPGIDELDKQAACFVTLHNADGSLRGCIGTILPVRKNLKKEIRENAISAALRDPRFMPVEASELESLEISVDVLGEPEPVNSVDELNPKVYGIIVSSCGRRGVLLPDLPGVTDVNVQIQIAMQKAGIEPGTGISVERFKVKRYY